MTVAQQAIRAQVEDSLGPVGNLEGVAGKGG
jgi:hypothetical protein